MQSNAWKKKGSNTETIPVLHILELYYIQHTGTVDYANITQARAKHQVFY